jgi:hypothetical protein
VSISFLARLEPRTRTDRLDVGLAAPVHDACWLLARQWQLAELDGDDGGSPIQVRHRYESWPILTYQPRSTDPTAANPDPVALSSVGAPLEAVVEAQPVRTATAWTTQLKVATGRELLRLLRDAGATTWIARLLSAYLLDPPDSAAPPAVDDGLRLVTAGRIPDGQPIYHDLSGVDLNTLGTFAGESVDDAFRSAATRWLAWCRATMLEPLTAQSAWSADRFEYNFRLAAPRPDNTVHLDAVEHLGGALDWYSFTTHTDPAGDPNSTVNTVDHTLLPTRVSFRGMPNPRWWELEDASIDFGDVEAHPADLARLALLEFALVYGNDHFIVPVQLDVGHLCRTTHLLTTDTFNVTTIIAPAAAYPRQDQRWTMFTLHTDDTSATSDIFLLPPTSPHRLESAAIEDVVLLRDEMANLAWAVERSFEGDDGRSADRARRSHQPPITDPPVYGTTLRYQLGTTVPPYWFPLVPEASPTGGPRLRLTEMQYSNDSDAEPHSHLIHIGQLIEDEELPREGLHLIRDRVLTRSIDGTPVAWTRHRTTIGRGEGSSGLHFDVVTFEPPPS